jgi:hypothetical protein
MATPKQIAANRENAKKSTGPRTEKGKAMSRMNALKHGIDARAETIAVEYPEELQELTAEYDREFQPIGIAERVLVNLLVRKQWLMNRNAALLANLTDYGSLQVSRICTNQPFEVGAGYVDNFQPHYRLHRQTVDAERAYFRYLKELEDRQAARREYEEEHPDVVAARVTPSTQAPNPEIGFVPQKLAPPLHSQSPAPTPISAIGQNQPAEIYCDLRVERS